MKKCSTSQRLKQIMQTRNLKQVNILEAAEPYCKIYRVKLGKNALSQYVSGKVEPGPEKLNILGLALDVSEAWLMGYDVPMERYNLILGDEYDPECEETQLAELLQLRVLFRFGYLRIHDMLLDLSTDEAHNFIMMLNFLMREWAAGSKKDKVKIELKIEEIIPERKRSICALAERMPPTLQQLEIYDDPIIIMDKRGVIAAGGDVCIGDFGIIMTDDSMIEVGVQKGDLCIIRPQDTIENGEIALVSLSVRMNSYSAIKKFYHENGYYRLASCNPKYKDEMFPESESEPIRIFGKFIKVIHSGL